ncbi:hypothetical protein [Gordonibacter sp.]|uniref:hypothetical protein n=2 Tax=Gordonibacter sp. TaxID=1968902 RepID=UPI002FC9ABC0
MLIPASEYVGYGLNPSDISLPRRLAGIEEKIRRATNNCFIMRTATCTGRSDGGSLEATCPNIKPGDTVEIESIGGLNDGLYVVASSEDGLMSFDRALLDAPANRATLVRYPPDVIEGALGMLDYDKRLAGKAGIASEGLSRHSVSYAQPSGESLYKGYPATVTAFLRPYVRARV